MRYTFIGLGTFVAVLLVACGQDYCVMGMGPCKVYEKMGKETSTGSQADLERRKKMPRIAIDPAVAPWYVGSPIALSATGGTPLAGSRTVQYRYFVNGSQLQPIIGTIDKFEFRPASAGQYELKVIDGTMQPGEACDFCFRRVTVE